MYVRLMILVLLLSATASASEEIKIQLIDKNDLTHITFATFKYNGQTGKSDENGYIHFQYKTGNTLQLSHVSYGSKKISGARLSEAIRSGKLILESRDVNIYPVTVIALRPKSQEKQEISLDHQDKMSHDGGAILNNTPVISTIRKGGNYGFDPVLRGFKYDQLNVVINGSQHSSAACPNRMDPATSQVAPNMIDRIEILKGPHALRYGSSFGGTINYVSSISEFPDKFKTYGRLSSGYDNNGNIFRSEGLLGFSNSRYDFGLFASWSQGKDYTTGNGNTVPADFLRASFGANLAIRFSEAHLLSISATRNIARDSDFPALPMDLISDDTWLLNLDNKMEFRTGYLSSWNTTVYGSFVDHFMDNSMKIIVPRAVNAETDAKTLNLGGRSETIWHFPKNKLYAGLDFRYENADGTRTRTFLMGPNAGKTLFDNVWQNGEIMKAGLFAEYHINTEKYHLIFAGRFDVNNSDISNPDNEFKKIYDNTNEMQINTSISIGGIRNVGNNINLGLWLGRATRSGSMTERFINYFPVGLDPYEMLGNPQIKPEINNQIDLTFEWKRAGGVINIDLFAAYLQDYISSKIDTTLTPSLPASPGVRQYTNIGQAVKAGFEINWTQNLLAKIKLQIAMAYTYGQNLELNEPLPEIAPFDVRFILIGGYFNKKLQPELAFRSVAEQVRTSKEYGETKTPAFELLDFKLSYRLLKILKISTGVMNIFDKNYYEHLSRSVQGSDAMRIFAPGRNFFLSFTLDVQ